MKSLLPARRLKATPLLPVETGRGVMHLKLTPSRRLTAKGAVRRRGGPAKRKRSLKTTLPLVGVIQRRTYCLSLRDSRACALPKLGAHQPPKRNMRERRV